MSLFNRSDGKTSTPRAKRLYSWENIYDMQNSRKENVKLQIVGKVQAGQTPKAKTRKEEKQIAKTGWNEFKDIAYSFRQFKQNYKIFTWIHTLYKHIPTGESAGTNVKLGGILDNLLSAKIRPLRQTVQ